MISDQELTTHMQKDSPMLMFQKELILQHLLQIEKICFLVETIILDHNSTQWTQA